MKLPVNFFEMYVNACEVVSFGYFTSRSNLTIMHATYVSLIHSAQALRPRQTTDVLSS